MRRLVLPTLAALFLLAGCAGQAATTSAGAGAIVLPHGQILPPAASTTTAPPGPDGAPPRPGLTSTKALGDPRTLSACALADPSRLTGGEFAEELYSLDTCELAAKLAAGEIAVYVGPLVHNPDQLPGADLGHGLSAEPTSGGGTRCTTALQYADYTDLEIEADVYGQGSADTCALATQAVRAAAALSVQGLAGGDRHQQYARGSFYAVDPCQLVTPALRSAAGLDVPDRDQYPEGHECGWTASSVDLDFPQVLMSIDADRLDDLTNGSTTQQIGGHTTYVTGAPPSDGSTSCFVQTPQQSGAGELQVATLEVISDADSATSAAVCQVGTSVAAVVWPHLPAPAK